MTGDKKTIWRTQAEALANRSAVASGVAVTFLLFGLIVVPALVRERRRPPLPPSDQPAAPSLGWLDPADAPPSKGRAIPPVDPDTVLKPTPKLIERGEALYRQHCSSCHGDTGRGDGPAAASLNPRPRDFTQAGAWKKGFHIPEVYETVSSGIQGTGMTAFDFLLPADRMALVHFVRSLASFDLGQDDPAKITALANRFRTQGVRIPNRIPVRMAIRKMVGEQPPPPTFARPTRADASAAAPLLRRVIADPERAMRTVAGTRQRDDLDAVARAWAAGSPANGFAPAVALLSRDEWRAVTDTLLGTHGAVEASLGEETKR